MPVAMSAADVRFVVYPFTRQAGDEDVVIGGGGGIFLAIPPEGLEVLDDLAAGRTLAEVRTAYEQRHGEAADVEEFLDLLAHRGFVRRVTEASAGGSRPPTRTPAMRYHFEDLSEETARRFFSAPALAAYAVIVLAAAVAVMLDPALLPSRKALYFEHHRTIKLFLVIGWSAVSLFVHEMAHLLAARAAGVKSRIGIGHRLWIVVAETDMTGLWAVPRRRRYLPLLAGMLADLTSGALFVLVLAAGGRGLAPMPGVAKELLRAVLFSYGMQLVMQAMFFVRTDLYYVFATMFDCKNLMQDTKDYLRNHVARVISSVRRVDQGHIPVAERRVVTMYAWIWLAGQALSLVLFFAVVLPLTVAYFLQIKAVLCAGIDSGGADYIDTLILTSIITCLYVVGLFMWLRSLKRSWKTIN